MNHHADEPLKGNILIVDDTPDNLRLLSSMLQNRGYRVRKALNGKIALMACQTLPPDVILLDINMPDMNGYQVCQALKSMDKTCEIPIIFISVLDNVQDKVKAFEVGGADYITKPFQFPEVEARVENQLNLKRLQKELQEKNQLLELQNARLRQEIEKRRHAEDALQQANQQLKELVCVDGLTQVANRRHFDEYLQKQWQRSQQDCSPLSLVLCDIDFFKNYNDTFGHLAGDACLQRVAKAIYRAVNRPNYLVARYGGEEFVVILPASNIRNALRVAKRIQHEIQQLHIHHPASAVSPFVTLSLGIASTIPRDRDCLNDLIHRADKALYRAKKEGRNRYCIDLLRSPPRDPQPCINPPFPCDG
ncbi:PleD family two-component system response regulator [Phormidium sp. CCY1219]|uniref:PleD family two-component system response regulator n=1 Tax=Phormidium sp. CCY1219 TaxID=2886104 RepID=UPI002D1E95CF|nr:PleD family two-component system response regulator [Phormidium sp. CCY1219]MEB3831834.1 PleD family two-component system response regulator [Phormidium sp. CCY1219]